jgi:hypothetical protein
MPQYEPERSVVATERSKSFCFFFQKEELFFFEKKNQKTFNP